MLAMEMIVNSASQEPTYGHFELVLEYVAENFAEEITLDDMAAAAGLSRFSLCRWFQRRFGVSPVRWLWMFRALLAHELISLEPRWSLTDIAFATGFTSSAHFSRFFRQVFGMPPSTLKAEAEAKMASAGRRSCALPFESLLEGNLAQVRKAAVAALKTSVA
jgi:transcriptional regulator GlxA family with amidase domain